MKSARWYEITLKYYGGKNEVKAMLEANGCKVLYLQQKGRYVEGLIKKGNEQKRRLAEQERASRKR